MENKPIEKKFSFLKRAEGFVHAGRGIYIFIKSTHSFWIEFVVFIIAILVGLFFKITNTEWILVIIISGIVFISEAFNSAIEIDINLTSPTYHPYARDTKDVAAGAVLLSALLAVVVGIIIFLPYFLTLFK